MQSRATNNRRRSLDVLYRRFAEQHLAQGGHLKGVDNLFADALGVSASTLSMAKSGARPIGDKLAAQIESRMGLESGWLSEDRPEEGLSPAEQSFVAIALQAYRSVGSDQRRQLRKQMQALIKDVP